MPVGLEFLNVLRVNRVVQALQDVRGLPQELLMAGRVPTVPATENEIIARQINRVQIADIIGDDMQAMVYNYGKMTFESVAVPNLKHGRSLTQEQINQLSSLNGPAGMLDVENSAFAMNERNILGSLLLGVHQRMEALRISMMTETMNYSRLGMNLNGVSWGMPSDLNVVPVYYWTDPVNATPIDDILNVYLYGTERYGIVYDRITMSTPAFRLMIATAQYQARAKLFLSPVITFTNLSLNNLEMQQRLFEQTTNMKLVRYDARYWSQDEFGNNLSYNFLPVNKVIIDSIANDGDSSCWDFGNVPTTESMISAMAPTSVIGKFEGPTVGPIGYATVPNDMNPPNITYWAVARGWPRKYRLQANAVITVGTFTDPVPFSDPF